MSPKSDATRGRILKAAAAIALGLLEAVTVQAQTVSPALRFEVASVKLAPLDGGLPRRLSGIPGPNNNDPGRFSAVVNLLNLVTIAYDIPGYRLSEQNDLGLMRLAVDATMPADTTREQFNVMLQNLLADRVGLKVHWTSKAIDTYSLIVAKGGPKLKPAERDSPEATDDASTNGAPPNGNPAKTGPDGFPIPPPGNAEWFVQASGGKVGMRGHNQTIQDLIGQIGGRTLDGPLTDATGLTGKYDYTLFWSMAAQTTALNPLSAAEPNGPNIFDAVQDQLGLRIEKTRSPVQVLVVDRVGKEPTGN